MNTVTTEAPSVPHLSPNLPPEVLALLAQASAALAAVASALTGNAKVAPASLPPVSASGSLCPTVRDCINEMIIAKARAERADRYIRQLRVSLGSFAKGKGNVPLCEITVGNVEKWLFHQGWKVKTMRGYLGDVRALFSFAMRRGYLAKNPALGVELPVDKSNERPPGIHRPEEVKRVLETARAADLDVMRHLALRYFAGVRSAEAHRMREEDLKIERGFIEVPAIKSKTRRRRLVKIAPALAAWLALGGTLRPIGPMSVRRVIKLSGVACPHNVTRHSFVSYHLAMWENAGKTALEAGHSEQMLFNHYRELVDSETAAAFWAIRPEALPPMPKTPLEVKTS